MIEETGTGIDYVVIGSGFGGSVSALRLAEKGYRVMVLEKGFEFEGQRYRSLTAVAKAATGSHWVPK